MAKLAPVTFRIIVRDYVAKGRNFDSKYPDDVDHQYESTEYRTVLLQSFPIDFMPNNLWDDCKHLNFNFIYEECISALPWRNKPAMDKVNPNKMLKLY